RRLLPAPAVRPRGAAGHDPACRAVGAGAGAGRAADPGLRLAASGPDLAVRAMDRAALRGPAVPAAAVADAGAPGHRRWPGDQPGGAADAALHLAGRSVLADRAERRAGAQPLPASCPGGRADVRAAAALLLSAGSVAAPGEGRAAGAHRIAAGAHPPALPVQ